MYLFTGLFCKDFGEMIRRLSTNCVGNKLDHKLHVQVDEKYEKQVTRYRNLLFRFI